MTVWNVRDFGAAGDGVTDDTAAVQSAIDAAAKDNRVLWFPRGRYAVRGGITVPSGMTLRAEATWGYVERLTAPKDRATDVEGGGNTQLVLLEAKGRAFLDLGKGVGTRILGISLNGNNLGENYPAIFAEKGAGSLVFEDVRCMRITGSCLCLLGVDGFAVRKGLFIQSKSHAVEASGSRDGIVIDSQLSYNGGAGFYGVGDMQNMQIITNRIEGGNPGGVYIKGCRGVSVDGNSFDTTHGPTVTLIDTVSGTVTGNMGRLSGHDQEGENDSHVLLKNCGGITVSANAYWGWPSLPTNPWLAQYGVLLKDCKDCVVTANTMEEACRKELVDAENCENTLVADNAGSVYPWTPPAVPRQ